MSIQIDTITNFAIAICDECDYCHNTYSYDIVLAERTAIKKGWKIGENYCYCPNCAVDPEDEN